MAGPERNAANTVALNDHFNQMMGLFLGSWASLDMTTDYAIGQFLGVSHEQAHLITAGMVFGRKARLLADLVGHSKHPKKAAILGAFNKARSASKRDIFVHSYWWSDDKTIKFLERSTSGEFKAKHHEFTLWEFMNHVAEFSKNATAFYNALGVTYDEMQAFGAAALSLSNKSKT